MRKLQLAAAWITVTVLPATVITPLRALAPVFASTEKLAVPGKTLLATDVTFSQKTPEVAAHPAQNPVLGTSTVMLPVDAAAPTLTVVGLTLKSHKDWANRGVAKTKAAARNLIITIL